MAGADNKSGREPNGRDAESIRQRLDKLGQQLADAKEKRAAAPQSVPEARGAALGKALRLATELVAGVAVGGFIGWALDRLFGVTMAERGVSQLVSVDLETAERLRDAG